jgi:hypothetical protein
MMRNKGTMAPIMRISVFALFMLIFSTSAFTPGVALIEQNLSSTRSILNTSSKMTLEDISDFYIAYPLQSAVLTCGVKASLADGIAQVKTSRDMMTLEWKRNLAYILYGGIFVGLMCHLEYDYVFPFLFGADNQSVTRIVQEVVFDNFFSGPFCWLPPAYLIKAIVYNYPLKEGLKNYVNDVKNNGLLIKYWQIWVPAQSISFSVIPDHLRVAFMASISFFWFILFSTVSSSSNNTTA